MKKTINLAVSLALLALPTPSPAQDRIVASFVIQRGKAPALTLNYDVVSLTNVLGTRKSVQITSFGKLSNSFGKPLMPENREEEEETDNS